MNWKLDVEVVVCYLQLHTLSESPTSATNVRTLVLSEDASPFTLRNLTPGANYRLELHSIFEGRDSQLPVVQNFTTSNDALHSSFRASFHARLDSSVQFSLIQVLNIDSSLKFHI